MCNWNRRPPPLLKTPLTNLVSKASDAEWSTLLVGYPKWKVDADNGKFPSVKIPRFVSSRTQEKDTQGGNVARNYFLTRVLSWTCTKQITLLPTSTKELSIPPALSFTKDQPKR